MKYNILVNILDEIRNECPVRFEGKYQKGKSDLELINQARARAYIHLYLKVSFGILDFCEREHFITDGTQDAGIDGYYIHEECRTVYFIQSKFRTTEKNFKEKDISYEELLAMDIDRVTNGEIHDDKGIPYSGKILQLQRELSNLPDIARYNYKVIVLANITNMPDSSLRKLCGGYLPEIFNYERCYEKLIFSVITGTYFNATDLNINIDLSNKNAGSKISYTVQTKASECDITVLFVPTIELAKVMLKYKNSILKNNPRSYLEHDGRYIHEAIRETIINNDTNEFALFNNGITMLSEETYINEKIGQKNKAQLTVKNPQILNGGQTCYTLSRIYEENKMLDLGKIFNEKEVLLKIITLRDNNSEEDKLNLIESISNATNKQTPVINADKFANEIVHINLQKIIFSKFGLLYERKRGEFADGIHNKYINRDLVIERNLFLRLFYSSNGDISKGIQKKLFQQNNLPDDILTNIEALDKFFIGYNVFKEIYDIKNPIKRVSHSDYSKVFLYTQYLYNSKTVDWVNDITNNIPKLSIIWDNFILAMKNRYPRRRIKKIDRVTGEEVEKILKWDYDYKNIRKDLESYLKENSEIQL